MPSANGVEYFWVLTTYVGVFLMVGFLVDVIGDRNYQVKRKLNGARKIVADAAIRRQALKITLSLALAIPATITFIHENPVPDNLRALNLICLSLCPILLLLINIVDRAERSSLDDYYEHGKASEYREH